jgi:ubiquinone/menaquinone biosynthesis C-methylase UbiE
MKRLMITVDVEAQPGRAERDHVDRLIWGKYPAGRAGIGEMMDIADKYGVKLTMFLDYCEEHLYGEALLDVGREIQRRGHDLQLHAHLDFLKRDFWATHAIPAETSLNELNSAQAEAAIGFLCDRHHHVSGREALAFRGGGYRYNGALLAAMVRHGVILDSSVNVSRPTQPIQLSPSKQFLWSSGCLEIPISCVAGYRGLGYLFDFNFNSGYFNNAAQMLDCLDLFYQEQGDEAVAVLVMHSWAFLKLTDKKYFTEIVPSQIEKFDAFLNLIAGQYQVVTATDIVALHAQNEIKLDPTQDFARLAERKQPTPTDAAPTIPGSTALSALVSEKDECPICGAAVARFIDMNGRRCPDCGSLERQRCFAIAYDQEIRQACDVAGKNVLIFSPSVSELRFLKAQGVAQATSVDIRPESKPDIIADVCAMPQIASGSQSVVFASYLMSCVYDMEAALDGIARILAPDGVYVSIETLRSSQPTIETTELAKITGHYGYDLYEKYKVGSFRVLGEDDYLATLLKKFSVSRFFATDPITGQLNIVHLCRPIDAGKAQMNITDNQFESNDAAFAEYMANTPDGTYAKFSVGNQVRAVQRGYRHPTLGKNLKRFDDFWEAGTSNFERYQYLLKFEKNQRFVDYGCGSLRLGAHFIRYLDPEGYFGLDVMTEFIEMGKENVGEALLLEKKPCFGPIDEHSLAKATEFCADIIISTSCAFQVHPDEKRRYIEDLKRLACKSTSIVCFDSKIAKEHFRYQSSAWVWTLDFYREAFSPMVLLATHKISEHNETGRDFEGMVLIFGHGSRDSVPEDLPKVLTKEQTPKGEQQESPIDESFAKLMRLEIEPTFAKTARPIRLLAHTPLSRAQKRIVEGFASTLPTVLDSWRSLADPVLARQAVELSGHKDESVDLFVSSDTLDFVADIEGTIKSIARVLRPGGAVVLRLKASRIANGAEPPTVAYQVDPRSVGLASGTSLPSMRVGREWILGAMTNAGLVAQHFRYAISKDGHEEWFLGRKQINDILAEFPAPGTTISTTCDICGSELTGLSEGDTGCPECKSRPRTRTLVKVSEVVSKALASSRTEEKSLLAFAMNGAEERVLAPQFNHIKSASLYGNYRTGHETGVDVRDLSRYKAASFDGVFGILLFDYFEEHEIALREIVRVLKPGGVLFTHIAPYRLADNQEEPPKNTSTIKKREGYFEYVPDDANMPSIRVGANWFMAAMRRAGLEGKQVEVIDSPTGERLVWFIGIKPKTLAGATCELVQQPFIRSKNVAHEYFQFPSGKIVYYRNVRSGLGSVLQAIDSLAVAEGVYPEPLSNTFVRGVRDRFRIKEKGCSRVSYGRNPGLT